MSHPASGSWRPHLLMGAIALLFLAGWGLCHQSREELWRDFESGDSGERIWALHVLSNRGEISPDDFSVDFIRRILHDEDTRVREMAFTYDLTKIRPPGVQQSFLGTLKDQTSLLVRAYLIQQRKVGGQRVGAGLKLKRQELEWFLEAMAGQELSKSELGDYFTRRKLEIGLRKGTIDFDDLMQAPEQEETAGQTVRSPSATNEQ